MKTINYLFISMILLVAIISCRKSEFLDKKPTTNITTPTTLTDFMYLLDNTVTMNVTGGLGQLSADEYQLSDADWATGTATERNAYIWSKDTYSGDVAIADWNKLYTQIFYCNSVLDGLAKSDSTNTTQAQYLKGWALFDRAYCNYDLIRTFCKAYSSTASSDLGIPLRTSSGIDKIQQRATLQQSFDQVFADLNQAANLLPSTRPSANLNRPFKTCVYALLARIYLDMRNYAQAENNVDLALNGYSSLIDYNGVDQVKSTPFSTTNDELIFNTSQVVAYGDFTPVGDFPAIAKIPQVLINSYAQNDLRLPIFFGKLPDNTYYKKPGYNGVNSYPFTGLATDELYLIKAECLARDGQFNQSMSTLNSLLLTRFKTGTFIPYTATSNSDALAKVLTERQKELIWRETRWSDLKRFNAEGANISLSRTVAGQSYSLPANDNRWILPIPSDEIALSGIQQNPR